MSIGPAAGKVYQAPGVWHLALLHRKDCEEHLFPLLTEFFRCGEPLQQTAAIERELLSEAEVGDIPSRQHLTELIRQLGDDHFAQREAADRQLRSFGTWLSWPLRQLDSHELDAEQLFRIQRILASLSILGADAGGRQVVVGRRFFLGEQVSPPSK